MKKTKYHHISRIDQSKGTHGWYVRTYIHGSVFSKFFSDAKSNNGHGGKARALRRAVGYRDIMATLVPVDKKSKLIRNMAFKEAMKIS